MADKKSVIVKTAEVADAVVSWAPGDAEADLPIVGERKLNFKTILTLGILGGFAVGMIGYALNTNEDDKNAPDSVVAGAEQGGNVAGVVTDIGTTAAGGVLWLGDRAMTWVGLGEVVDFFADIADAAASGFTEGSQFLDSIDVDWGN